MLFKSLIAAAAIAGTALTAAATAEAKTKFDVYVDFGTPGYYDAGYGYDEGYGYDDEEGHRRPHHGGWRISCGEGKMKVRHAGFRNVRTLDCDGRTYSYKAKRHGEWFVVTVGARRGRIVDVNPLY